jgi:hypothetical protein
MAVVAPPAIRLPNDEWLAGLGQLVNNELEGNVSVFGCPLHSKYTPDAVEAQWNTTDSPVYTAYLWRETDAGAKPNIDQNDGLIAILMDNCCTDTKGSNWGHAHNFENVNVLYTDNHTKSFENNDVVGEKFTHDAGGGPSGSITKCWNHADEW